MTTALDSTVLENLDQYIVREGLPWWSSGEDSALPLQGAWIPSLVGELKSHMLCGKKKKCVGRVSASLNKSSEFTLNCNGFICSFFPQI